MLDESSNLWEKLRKLVTQRIGFKIRLQDVKYFQLKVEKRIKLLKLSNLQEYYSLLSKSELNSQKNSSSLNLLAQQEWEELTSIVTNGESFFFRDRGQINTIANEILPQIIAKKRQEKETGQLSILELNIWSAGCSTGEEVYSLAILINELISDLNNWKIKIIGTDINQKFLEVARQGIYKKWSFRLTDRFFKTKYFISNGEYWQVKPNLKKMVTFYQDNLIDIKQISHRSYSLDLVICRNVFIYFDPDSIAKAIKKITSTLCYQGYFIPGHAELQRAYLSDFKAINFPESIVYQYLPNYQSDSFLVSKTLRSAKKPYYSSSIHNRLELSSNNGNKFAYSQSATSTHNQPNSTQAAIKKMQGLLEKGEYKTVINQGTELIHSKAHSKEVLQLVAQAYANQGNAQKAEQHCNEALEIDYTYIAPLFLLVQIAESQDKYRKVKELLKKIIYIDPLSVAAYLDLGEVYSKEGDLARSHKMYQTAYDILTKLPAQNNIDYQGNKSVSQLLNYVKFKL